MIASEYIPVGHRGSVAAELRLMADRLEKQRAPQGARRTSQFRSGTDFGLIVAIGELRRRADELNPPTSMDPGVLISFAVASPPGAET